jgi:hypothetical protein
MFKNKNADLPANINKKVPAYNVFISGEKPQEKKPEVQQVKQPVPEKIED